MYGHFGQYGHYSACRRYEREALQSTAFHNPYHPAGIGQISGNAPDVEIHARELLREQQLTRELLARDTGQQLDRIAKDFDRDLFMTPQQALEYGIIDQILTNDEHDRPTSAL